MEGEEVGEVERMDRSFHSLRAGRLNISELDPSLSLCFLCHTEQDFDNLCIGEERTDFQSLHSRSLQTALIFIFERLAKSSVAKSIG
jgi:hypothetical protein